MVFIFKFLYLQISRDCLINNYLKIMTVRDSDFINMYAALHPPLQVRAAISTIMV
jgi:hypothetical protein